MIGAVSMPDHRRRRADVQHHAQRSVDSLPTLWLLLYGAAFVKSGNFSLRVIPVESRDTGESS